MKLDNPKLTAFALDELDPIERAEIEALLEQHPEALDEINKTIEVSSLLRNVLQSERADGFTGDQREAILNNTATLTDLETPSGFDARQFPEFAEIIPDSAGWQRQLWMQAVAACVMVGVGLYFLYADSGSETRAKAKSDVAQTSERQRKAMSPGIVPENRLGEIAVRLFEEEEVASDLTYATETSDYEMISDKPVSDAMVRTKPLTPGIEEAKQRPFVPEITIDSTYAVVTAEPAPLNPQPLQITKQTPKPDSKKSIRIFPAEAARKLITAIPTRDKTLKTGGGKLDAIAAPGKIPLSPADVPSAEEPPVQSMLPALIQKGLLARNPGQFVRVATAPLSQSEINFNHARFVDLKSRLAGDAKKLPTIPELVNSFHYTLPDPEAGQPFGVTMEVASCPWQPRHRLVLVAARTADVISKMKTDGKVGLQVDFNPLEAVAYRLLGQEETPSGAGESSGVIRPDSTVTALYEVIPAEQPVPEENFQQSKYLPWNTLARKVAARLPSRVQQELLTVTLYYQNGAETTRHTIEKSLVDEGKSWTDSSASFRWAASVTGFGMLLHQISNAADLDIGVIKKMAQESSEGLSDRAEFLLLIDSLLSSR